MSGDMILLWIVLLPLTGGLVSCALRALFGRNDKKTAALAEKVVLASTLTAVLYLAVMIVISESRGMSYALSIPKVCGMGLEFVTDGFRALYVMVSVFAWLTTTVFFFWYGAGEGHQTRYYAVTMLTLACTLGVLLSADLFTLFVFFEGMSLASYVWVVQEQTKEAIEASKTYLAVSVIGGLVLLTGILLLWHTAGTLQISELRWACVAATSRKELYVAGGCLLFGFGAKAGCWPLHIWLPKAHPEAPASASALLSGILTKTGVFGVMILSGRVFVSDISWGKILTLLGVVTMLVGAIRALFSIDIKHMLACSSVSQIGFILTGAGVVCAMTGGGYAYAISGSVLHMLNHSMFKLILFLSAGIVVKRLHTRDLNKVRGFGRNKPWLMILVFIASLGIAGVPGFSGYVSKTLIHEAIVHCHEAGGGAGFLVAEYLFLAAGGCTLAYMTKFFVVLFLRKPSKEVLEADAKYGKHYAPVVPMVLMSAVALFIFVAGTLPEVVMRPIGTFIAPLTEYPPLRKLPELFGWECLEGSLISITIGVLLFFFAVRPAVMKRRVPLAETPEYVDRAERVPGLEDALYRPLLLSVLPTFFGTLMRGLELATEGFGLGVFKICKSILTLLDKTIDAAMLLLRRTVLRPVCEQRTNTLGESLCNPIGQNRNGIRRLWNATFGRKNPKQGDCVAAVNRARENVTESVKLVSRSLSYGLMAFCIGLIILLVYILLSLG